MITSVEPITWILDHYDMSCLICHHKTATHRVQIVKNEAVITLCVCPACLSTQAIIDHYPYLADSAPKQ